MKLPGTATQPENIHIALGKLEVLPGMVFLDVGCGSGAVSLAAYRFTEHVYGIDRREEAVLASQSLVPGGTFIHGEAGDILEMIPPADRCFIGGTRGIEDFLPQLTKRANPGCRIVVNLARMGIASQVAELMAECCTLEEVLQVQICRGYPLAGDWALRPVNPIFMVVGHC